MNALNPVYSSYIHTRLISWVQEELLSVRWWRNAPSAFLWKPNHIEPQCQWSRNPNAENHQNKHLASRSNGPDLITVFSWHYGSHIPYRSYHSVTPQAHTLPGFNTHHHCAALQVSDFRQTDPLSFTTTFMPCRNAACINIPAQISFVSGTITSLMPLRMETLWSRLIKKKNNERKRRIVKG